MRPPAKKRLLARALPVRDGMLAVRVVPCGSLPVARMPLRQSRPMPRLPYPHFPLPMIPPQFHTTTMRRITRTSAHVRCRVSNTANTHGWDTHACPTPAAAAHATAPCAPAGPAPLQVVAANPFYWAFDHSALMRDFLFLGVEGGLTRSSLLAEAKRFGPAFGAYLQPPLAHHHRSYQVRGGAGNTRGLGIGLVLWGRGLAAVICVLLACLAAWLQHRLGEERACAARPPDRKSVV